MYQRLLGNVSQCLTIVSNTCVVGDIHTGHCAVAVTTAICRTLAAITRAIELHCYADRRARCNSHAGTTIECHRCYVLGP